MEDPKIIDGLNRVVALERLLASNKPRSLPGLPPERIHRSPARSRSGAGGSETTSMMSLLCQRIASEFGFPLQEVAPSATLEHDLGLDRFDVFEFLDALEAAFSVSIADEEAKSVRTVSDLEHLISTSLARTAA